MSGAFITLTLLCFLEAKRQEDKGWRIILWAYAAMNAFWWIASLFGWRP